MKKSIILLFTILFLSINIFAKQIEAKYIISYGNFLNLGIAISTLKIEDNNYKIKMEVKTTGMAKILTNNRVEIYESHGKLINDEFVPNKFIKIKKDKYKKRVRVYTFNYDENKIFLEDKKTEQNIKYNKELKQEFITINKEENSILDYFARNDILSLFFNLKNRIKNFENSKEYSLKAIGANKTKGLINLIIPNKNSLKELNKYLKTDDKSKFTVFINQKIFQSNRGELLISLNEEGFCTYAVLKDVIFFGDIVGKIVDFKID